MSKYGLGRLHSVDERDKDHLISAHLDDIMMPYGSMKMIEEGGNASNLRRFFRYHDDNEYWFDQLATSMCVEFSFHHLLVDGPIKQRPAPLWQFGTMYHEAQKVDEWEGEDYEGTSVRAGAKVLKSWGYIDEYLWAWDVDTVAQTVIHLGPVVIGSNWYDTMFETDSEGIIRVGGNIAGGHAYEISGINMVQGLAKIKNSWGRNAGLGGHFYLPLEDLDRLIKEDGEACLVVEHKV